MIYLQKQTFRVINKIFEGYLRDDDPDIQFLHYKLRLHEGLYIIHINIYICMCIAYF